MLNKSMISARAFVCLLGFLLVTSALSVNRLEAQVANATISGTATDSSGAVLAGAKIQATNTGTGVSQSTATDAQGRYTLSQLSVGTYTVQASQTGFQTVVHSGITLSVGGYSVVDFSLPVGQVSQTVNVEAQVSQVETQSSAVSSLVSPQQMRELPLNGRNYEQLITLAPGVTTVAAYNNPVTGRIYGMQNNYSVSGNRTTGQAFMMDNTDVRDFWEHGVGSGYAGTSLGVEAISEFQVLTNTYDAQFPGNGVVVNSVTRSGSNELHGSGYEFIRNSKLDARDFQDPASGPPPFRRNQFGGAIGGPITKDKLFFFGNYEGMRQSLASTTAPFAVLEPYVAQGKLPCSALSGSAGGSAYTGCPAWTGAPPANPALGQTVNTPANPLVTVTGANSTAEQVAALFGLCKPPVCRTLSGDLGGYYEVASAPALVVNEDFVLGRVDYNIGPHDSMFGRYALDDARLTNNPQDPMGIFPELDFTRNQYLTITERHIVSDTMVNSLRFGFVRSNENSHTALGLTAAQKSAAGLASDPLDFTRTLYSEPLRPDGQVNPFASAGFLPVGPNPDRPEADIQNKFSGGDDLVWTKGSHSFKIGGVVTRMQFDIIHLAYTAGTYFSSYGGFAGSTADPASAVATTLQNYLLGIPLTGFATPKGFADATRYFREVDIAPYIQDDWKITPRLTLNLGMRYDYGTNPVGWTRPGPTGGSLTTVVASFLPPTGPLTPSTATYCPFGFGPGLCFPPTGDPATLFTKVRHAFSNSPNAANWAPRVGLAYDPFANHKTSIRAGFGIFHDPVSARTYESGFVATPPAITDFLIAPGFPDAFSAGFPLQPGEYAGVDYLVPHGSPYAMQYNLNVQREIAPGTMFLIGYIGSVNRHLWSPRDANPPLCLTYPSCSALPTVPKSLPTVANPQGYYVDPSTGAYGSGTQFPFVPGLTGPRINPDFGTMIIEATTGASSYNSLQTGVTHQFGKRLSGQVYYTWSHCIDDGSFTSGLELQGAGQIDGYNQTYEYANCIFDVRHNLSVNGLYSLPFKGNRLVEGWQVGTIFGAHSGQPVNVSNGQAADPASLFNNSRPNYSFAAGCTPNHIINQVKTDLSGQKYVQWFDPKCYVSQANGFLGNVVRNSVPGPGAWNLDLSITKDTTVKERLRLQFRAEFFNILNHFNPGPPTGLINQANGFDGQTRVSQAPVITPRQLQFALKLNF